MWRIIHFSSNVLFCIATLGFLLSLPSLTTMFTSVFGTGSEVIAGIYKDDTSRDLGVDNSRSLYDLMDEYDRETAEKLELGVPVSYALRLGTVNSLDEEALYGVYDVYVDETHIDLVEEAPKGSLRNWVRLEGDSMKKYKQLLKNPKTKLINMSFL